jgi:hypothetical protein
MSYGDNKKKHGEVNATKRSWQGILLALISKV